METSYYPWNSQALATWIRIEQSNYSSRWALATAMGVPVASINVWLGHSMPPITLAEMEAIAQYRRWGVQQTLTWLAIKPAHLQSLIAQAVPGHPSAWAAIATTTPTTPIKPGFPRA